MKKIVIHTDGGSRGNPGPAGIGAVIADARGKILKEVSEYLGKATNNVAEYTAVLRAVEETKKLFPKTKEVTLDCYLDSQLVERQLNGIYKIKDANLKIIAKKIKVLLAEFGGFAFTHIYREKNEAADELANRAMDKA
ncbi:ribonuclease HI family protein [Candidatus Parcubacteria bacterium]|uniref:Ribonuclease H n=1 Tax=Candidatus Kaiserbacteria bacterium CG10_big_fil_rev_8_21_14_0_10_47_16 TaxID=1974608 RepID=A0A2H0UFI8_9BACT|nr:ribonuclease HI family protein [Candidatus Parcubacteria bacterium]PIR84555.1 MAG: ribonuclease H [Candidatus Kaiserbacteria bacterium CG10_big_fil_rev_8_21_14_0_10_47_16]